MNATASIASKVWNFYTTLQAHQGGENAAYLEIAKIYIEGQAQ